jgi:hypothetical protein
LKLVEVWCFRSYKIASNPGIIYFAAVLNSGEPRAWHPHSSCKKDGKPSAHQKCVALPAHVEESRFKWKRFPELLNDPQARWVLRDVEVQDPPTVMTDHEEAVEDTKRDRWNSEEIHRRNRFPMIAQKG